MYVSKPHYDCLSSLLISIVLCVFVFLYQVKQYYIDFLLHCYVDAEVDNKETFTKEFMWDLFQNMSEDIHHVYRENGEGDEELTKYVTINLPRCLISYFSSKMVISFIKIPVRNIPLSHLSLSFMSHPSFIVLSLYLTYHSIL